jgi:hypothetical protein
MRWPGHRAARRSQGVYAPSLTVAAPTWEARMIDLGVRLPLPPAERPGSIYEIQTVLKRTVFAGR